MTQSANPEFVVGHVTPGFLSVVPICDDTELNGILQRQRIAADAAQPDRCNNVRRSHCTGLTMDPNKSSKQSVYLEGNGPLSGPFVPPD